MACRFILPPAHTVEDEETIETGTAGGSKSISCKVSIQLLLSTTFKTYVPEDRATADCPVCKGEVFQRYEYGGVPPVTETSICPSTDP